MSQNLKSTLTVFVIGLIFSGFSSSARADASTPRYTISGIGHDSNSPHVDQSGNFMEFSRSTAGIYTIGESFDPKNYGVPLFNYLYAAGSNVNLLPSQLQSSNFYLRGVNSSGDVVGFLFGSSPKTLFASPLTGEVFTPKLLPGQTNQSLSINGINDKSELVGNADNGPVYYSSPTASPIPLSDLIPPNSGWVLVSATDINDRGQIVGLGANPSGQAEDFILTPTSVPEPASLSLFVAIFALIATRRSFHS